MNWKKLFLSHGGMGHMKGMALIVGGAFVVLVLIGKPVSEAILYALVLACPLMMIGMMFGGHGGHGSGQRPNEAPEQRGSANAARGNRQGPHDHH